MLSCSIPVVCSHKNADSRVVSFRGRPPKIFVEEIGQFVKLPDSNIKKLTVLENVDPAVRKAYLQAAAATGESVNDLLRKNPLIKAFLKKETAVASHSIRVGNNKITSLMDGGQIFKKTLSSIVHAEKSIQVRMFEFQNLTVDGNHWATQGAETVKGANEQRRLLETIIAKKKQKPEMKIQIILDNHKWGIDSFGKKKHFNNEDMIVYLKQNGIDVVPAAKESTLNHDKFVIIDGKEVIIGGMNWGTHSPANHDLCFHIIKNNQNKASEVDNIMELFNTDWKFAWFKIATGGLVPGPLSKAEQKFYNGMDKLIKEENVLCYEKLKPYFDIPEAKNRYFEGDLDLIETKPIKNPMIKLLSTRPYEYKNIDSEGSESARQYLMEEIKNSKEVFGELFYFTSKEIIETIAQRVKKGDLKAQFLVSEADFPYCKNAFHKMIKLGIDVRVYNADKSVNQRPHSKWAVFDQERILCGSVNWSDRGLQQNRAKGFRDDTPLVVSKIEDNISEVSKDVDYFEKKLGLPSLKWDRENSAESYEKLKKMSSLYKSVYNKLNKNGKVNFRVGKSSYTFYADKMEFVKNGQTYKLSDKDERNSLAILRKIRGYYNGIADLHRSKPKYDRGNSESAIAFVSKSMVKKVLEKQFKYDWKISESAYDAQNRAPAMYIAPKKIDLAG